MNSLFAILFSILFSFGSCTIFIPATRIHIEYQNGSEYATQTPVFQTNTPEPTPTQEVFIPTPKPDVEGIVSQNATPYLKVRTSPFQHSSGVWQVGIEVGRLYPNDRVIVISCLDVEPIGMWCQVRRPDEIDPLGWVSMRFVLTNG